MSHLLRGLLPPLLAGAIYMAFRFPDQPVSAVTSTLLAGVTAWLAVETMDLARSARRQLDRDIQRERDQNRPRLFMKDIWVGESQVQAGGKGYRAQLVTKGIANLGPFAVAIQDIQIMAKGGAVILVDYPMIVIGPGLAHAARDDDPNKGSQLCRVRMHKDALTSPQDVEHEAESLRILFRHGTDPRNLWEMRLPRLPRPGRSMSFAGEDVVPTLVARTPG